MCLVGCIDIAVVLFIVLFLSFSFPLVVQLRFAPSLSRVYMCVYEGFVKHRSSDKCICRGPRNQSAFSCGNIYTK